MSGTQKDQKLSLQSLKGPFEFMLVFKIIVFESQHLSIN